MTTLEARYVDKIGQYQQAADEVRKKIDAAQTEEEKAVLQSELCTIEEEEVQYMATAASFIKDYFTDKPMSSQKASGTMDSFMTVTSKSNRNTVLQRYLLEVEKDTTSSFIDHVEHNELVCTACARPMLLETRESSLICSNCGLVRPYLGNTEANLSYQEEISQNVISSFSYKRLNHFSEWLSSIQARATTEIGQEVIDAVKAEFKKNRISQRKDITPAKVRQYLKKLNLNKLYEHSHYICSLINGVPPPVLEPELETQLKHMFVSIQEPFERAINGTGRKNFLSYSFTLYKMCELLGRDDLLCHFSLLRSSEKLHAQDKIWRAITSDPSLHWEFIPSV